MPQPKRPLSDFLHPGLFRGASLILPMSGKFLFGLRAPKLKDNQVILELTGIGGGMESADKSLSDTAQREAAEEIGCHVALEISPSTLVVYNQKKMERVEIVGKEKPAAIIYRNYRTPPHQPWHSEHSGLTCLLIFIGKIIGQPKPSGELPWLIWINSRQILQTASYDIPLEQLLRDGARLISAKVKPPAKNTMVRLTDSQEALAMALREDTIPFYENYGKLT